MHYFKLALGLLGILVSFQTVPALYHSNQFDEFVKSEVQRSRTELSARQISRVILTKAGQYSVPLKQEDINVRTRDGVIRVEVNYRIPIDLLVYTPEMRFRTVGGALLTDYTDYTD
jgi:hypothetical protein